MVSSVVGLGSGLSGSIYSWSISSNSGSTVVVGKETRMVIWMGA